MARFSITTLGCKVNQYDGQAIAEAIESAGWHRAAEEAPEAVDLVVINTCCVTATAMSKSRQAIRRAVRRSPAAAVLVAGCYGDYDARRIAALLADLGVQPERAAVVGHHGDLAACVRSFARLPSRPNLRESHPGNDEPLRTACDARIIASPASIKTRRQAVVKANVPRGRFAPIRRFAGRQRAFVKVQDGCDAFCSYCIVPFTRPRLESRPIDEVVDECRRLVAAGHREIVLCGVFLGAFGRSTAVRKRWGRPPAAGLAELLRRVAAVEGIWRVRLSSLEPGDVTDDLLSALAELPAAAPHLHLPLQSGSRRILRRMNRQYAADQYRRTVDRVRAALDRPALTTDVIVGFPGEDDEDFAATLALVRHAGFAKIHAFPFSAIEGTAARAWRGEAPPPAVVKARLAELAELERQLADDFRRQFVGETMEALVERPRRRTDTRRAMTDRYLPVTFLPPAADGGHDGLTGQVIRLRIDSTAPGGLRGRLEQRG